MSPNLSLISVCLSLDLGLDSRLSSSHVCRFRIQFTHIYTQVVTGYAVGLFCAYVAFRAFFPPPMDLTVPALQPSYFSTSQRGMGDDDRDERASGISTSSAAAFSGGVIGGPRNPSMTQLGNLQATMLQQSPVAGGDVRGTGTIVLDVQ